MAERPLQVGDPIPGEKVNPLTIGQILDYDSDRKPIGHLLVDREQGNIHVYWYRWVRETNPNGATSYRKVLTHHGGLAGFDTIQKPIDQHQRIIARYMGVETEVDKSSEEPGEQLLRPPFTLRTYAQALRIGLDRVEIPGERAWIGDCLSLIERAIRGASLKMPAAELQSRLSTLSQLQPKFDRSKNPSMQQASRHLLQAVEAAQEENRDEAMYKLLEMGKDINSRAQEISDILAATIQRESRLEIVRNRSEDVVTEVHFDVVRAKERWDRVRDDEERQKIILNLTNLLGVRRLSELTVQPFKQKAQKRALVRLGRLGEYWVEGNMELVGRVLTEGAKELINWRGQIKKRVEGEYQMRFPST